MYKSLYLLLFFIPISLSVSAQQLSIQTGHSSTIYDLEFSPSGAILASCGADNKIVLWDMKSAKQMNILSGHQDVVNSISFHPSKNLMVSASDDSTVKIWEYPSGKLIKTYSFFHEEVKSVLFSKDGDKIVCGTQYINFIDIKSDNHWSLNIKAKKSFNALAFNKAGNELVFGERGRRKCYIYDLVEKKVVQEIRIRSNAFVFSEDNKYLYVAGSKGKIKKIKIGERDKENDTVFIKLANYSWNSFYSIALSKNFLFAANKDNLIYVYDKDNGKKVETLKAHSNEVRAVAIDKSGNYMASAGKDRKIIIWSVLERKIIKVLKGGAISINTISFSSNGNTIFIGYGDGSYKTWDLKSKSDIKYIDNQVEESNLWQKKSDYSCENVTNPINNQKLMIKVNKRVLNNYSDKIFTDYKYIELWDIKNKKVKKLSNKKSSEYQDYFLLDTTSLISIQINATYSQKYSLLDHKKIKDRETVTSIVVQSSTFVENEKDIDFVIEKSFEIEGDIYYKNISNDGKTLIISKYIEGRSACELWDIDNGKMTANREFAFQIKYASIDLKNRYIVVSGNRSIYIFDIKEFKPANSLQGMVPFSFSSDGKYMAYTDNSKNLILYNLENNSVQFKVNTNHQTNISDIKFNNRYGYIATSGYDGLIKFWKINSGDLLLSVANFYHNDYIYVSPDNYYFSAKNAMNYIGFLVNDNIYSFEQFDLKYNRPDIVFGRIDYSNEKELLAYKKAYLKRIKKLGFNMDAFESEYNFPDIEIENREEIPLQTTNSSIKLKLVLSDSIYKINRLNIWINDVAIYGVNGESLKELNSNKITKEIMVELAQGDNRIQVSCLNDKGAESFKETILTKYVPDKRIEQNLYLITIGASTYEDTRFNLEYAAKDAEDVAKLFNRNGYFDNIYTKTLTDKQVNKENIALLKTFLNKSGINDQVIVFVAAHGVLDENMDYYIASNNMDFNNPSEKGIPYEELENLLDGIKPLKKIILMDACHSGEIDKDEMELATNEQETNGDITFRAAGAGVVQKSSDLGLESTSALTKSLFTDLRKGTGATVISSAGGGEYAMESGEWKNGLFTYCLIKGIKTKAADLNDDGEIWLSELQKYVQQQVVELSNGQQQPTSRIENNVLDYRVW